jgi:ACS family tartrate transporter-like MFS transporter
MADNVNKAQALREPTRDFPHEASTISQATWRCVPLLFVSYIICYVDRVNVGFAAITANKEIGLSPATYGLGAGLLFVGYFVFEVPSNIMLERVGARFWIGRIMITWGLISLGMVFVKRPWSFYTMRFLLGAAEAGFFPGIILYLTYWFPRRYRARNIGLFALGIPMSSLVGAPFSGLILGMNGVLGIKGWQWLYILESLPAILLGFFVLFFLTDAPRKAHWLSPEQRAWLQAEVDRDRAVTPADHGKTTWRLLADRRVLVYSAAFFCTGIPSYGLGLWLPQMVKSFGLTNAQTGFVTAIPFAFGCLALVLWAFVSDWMGERVWNAIAASLVAALGLALCVATTSLAWRMAAVSFAALGIWGLKSPFLAMLSEAFSETTAAAGIAMVSSLGNLSGWAAPYMVGLIKSDTGSYSLGLLALGAFIALGAVIMMIWIRPQLRIPAPAALT